MKNLGGVVSEDYLLEQLSEDKVIQNHLHFHLVVGDNFKKHKEDGKFKPRWSVNGELATRVHEALEKLHLSLSEEDLLSEEHMILRFLDRLDGVEDGYVDDDIARQFLTLSKIVQENPLGDWGLSSSQNYSVR